MDPFTLPPLAALLDLAHTAVSAVSEATAPVVGDASAALAVVLLTLVVRAALVPVGASQVRAESVRRRLAPQLAALRRRYRDDPRALQTKTLELYRREKASPMAGVLPTLAQVPVISTVYALFVHPVVAGHSNVLLSASLLGAPLGSSIVQGMVAAPTWPVVAVFLGVLLVVTVAAWMTRNASMHLDTAAGLPDTARSHAIASALSWLPFVAVIVASLVPLAAALYLATSTWWTVAERALLRRRFGLVAA
jgi:YidC/Oxa1 family membrane protein insertase